MYELTEDDKKRLTEFLGECWHENKWDKNPTHLVCACGYLCQGTHVQEEHCRNNNRTFATGNDMVALKEKLIEAERWWEFEQQFCLIKWDWVEQEKYQSFLDWIFTPTRFCWLVSEYLEEQG